MSSDKLGLAPALPSNTDEAGSNESSPLPIDQTNESAVPSDTDAAYAAYVAKAEAKALAQAEAKARARLKAQARAKEKRAEKAAAAKAQAGHASAATESSPQVTLDLRLPDEPAPAATADAPSVPAEPPVSTELPSAPAKKARASRSRAKPSSEAPAPTAAAETTASETIAATPTPTLTPTAASADAADAASSPAPTPATGPSAEASAVAALMTHRVHPIALGRKREALRLVLEQVLAGVANSRVLVYTRTKHGADKIARFLERCGMKAAAIHGDKSQGARARALGGFQSGEMSVLVVTDIAARVLTLEPMPLIINYDLPYVAEDYLQRVGRALQQDGSGVSLSLITQEESPQLRAVRDLLPAPMQIVALDGFEAAEPFDPERDPPPRPEVSREASGDADAAAGPHPRNEKSGRGRRDRRNRNGRVDARIEAAPATETASPGGATAAAEGQAQAADAGEQQPARKDHGPRAERAPRVERQARGDRQPRAPKVSSDEDSDGPERGNSLAAPPPSQLNQGGQGRRRGRRDPFAPVVIDENRANIYDERQPDDYRDQWSVLGPDTERPAWTYADHHVAPTFDPQARPADPARRQGSGGGGKPRGKGGAGRHQQRSGKRRADNG